MVLSGEFLGAVEVVARRLVIPAGAVLHGNLRYRSPERAAIDPQARVLGTVTYEPTDGPAVPEPPPRGAIAFAVTISLAVTGIVLLLLFPGFAMHSAQRLRLAPWPALGLGLAVLAATPLVVVLLMVTLVGMWLGLMLAAFYAMLLLGGFLAGVHFLGERGLHLARRGAGYGRGLQVLGLVLALVAVALIGRIPLLGPPALFALLLFGLGALVLAGHTRYRAAGAPP